MSDKNGSPMPWFYAFGTMLEYVADRTFSVESNDIDLGVFYDRANWSTMIHSWESYGFKVQKTIVSDVTGNPLNLHMVPDPKAMPDWPTIDIFAFVRKGGQYLYTYDMDRSGKSIPNPYKFKTVAAEFLSPPRDLVESIWKRSHPETKRMLDADGIWHYDVFEDHGPYKMAIPFAYGSLCDLWYRGWRFRKWYKGQSWSDEWVTVKSCKEIGRGI